MKVICPISGISYQVSLPTQGKATFPHPIFSQSLQASDLIKQYLESWASQSLTSEETHLLGLALIMKLPLVSAPVLPPSSHIRLAPFWEKYIDRIAKLASKLEGKDFKQLPKLRVDIESIPHLPHWIDLLHTEASLAFSPISEKAKKLNRARFLSQDDEKGAYTKEEIDSIILRGLKNSPLSAKESRTFPSLIAAWACNVGEFPTAYVTQEDGKKLIIADLWKGIIEKAFSKNGAYEILGGDVTLADAEELLDYCYEEIPVGSLHASIIFKKLEEVRDILEEFRSGLKPQPIKAAEFLGSEDDLLSLLSGDAGQLVQSPSGSATNSLSPSQLLAIKMAKIRSIKA